MKVIHLSLADVIGGASRAAHRIHLAMRQIGIDSSMWVQTRAGDDATVFEPRDAIGKMMARGRLFAETLPPLVHPKRLRPTIFSSALFADPRLADLERLAPDVVHLHWVSGGMVSIESLPRLNRPIVWTLHDSWAFTGGCHIPYDCTRYRERCGQCPVLGSSHEQDLSRLVIHRKERVYPRLRFAVVTPSRWLANAAASSQLLRDHSVEVIRNCLDLERFRPIESAAAKTALSLPHDRKLILFGAHRVEADPNKGFHLLVPALRRLAAAWRDHADLVIFGAGRPATEIDFGGMRAHYMGHLHDDISLALAYSAADVFVAPSILENLPNTVVEAMACGTPSVGFGAGGMRELIEHHQDGYLAQPYDVADLAAGIEWVLGFDGGQLRQRCRSRAERDFRSHSIAEQYRAVYERVLA